MHDKKQALIIDPQINVDLRLKDSLERMALKVAVANNGYKGASMASLRDYDIILLDIATADPSGFKVLEEIKSGGQSQNSPIMIVSAKSGKDYVYKALKLGACDFVVKPFNEATLLHKVARWTNSREEAKWKDLEPDQERALRLTVATLDKANDAVIEGRELPFEDIKNTGREIINVIEKNQVKPILDALKTHDSYTFVHSMRVGIFLSIFARNVAGFSKEDLGIITEGGIIHDIGKAKTPLWVLNKPGGFEPEEWQEMKNHVIHGVEALKRSPNVPEAVIEIAWNHHEKMDGSGYPRGLKATDVGILARMASIVDMYVALTDKRVYKPGFTNEKSFGIMEQNPNHLDQKLVKDFKELIFTGGLGK